MSPPIGVHISVSVGFSPYRKTDPRPQQVGMTAAIPIREIHPPAAGPCLSAEP